MKCKDFEQDIYLYSELSKAEKLRLNAHLQECAECKALFQLVLVTQELITKESSAKPEVVNHARLTSNIIQAIQAESPKQSVFAARVKQLFLKYSFATASLTLVILFVTEQQTSSEPEKVVIAGTVTLKSFSASEILDQRGKQKTSLYACVKSENCNNTFVENLKQKKFNHENL